MRSITTTIRNPSPTPKKITFFGRFLGIPTIQELPIIYRREEDLGSLPDAEQVFVYQQKENENAPIILKANEVQANTVDPGFRRLENEVLTNPIRILGIKIRSSNQEQYFNSNLTYVQKSAESSSESRVTITTGYNPSHNNPVLELSDGNQFKNLIFDGSSYLQLENLQPNTSITVEFQYITQQDVLQQQGSEEPNTLTPPKEEETQEIDTRNFFRRWFFWTGTGKRPWWSYVVHPVWFPISLVVLVGLIIWIANHDE